MTDELKVGDTVPDFTAQSVRGGKFTLSEKVREHPILFYFYPVNYGMQCIFYSESMNDFFDGFEKIGVKVFHVNDNTVENHEKYMKRLETRYDHIADIGRAVSSIFGMIVPSNHSGTEDLVSRGFAFVDRDMVLRYRWRGESMINLVDLESLVKELGDILAGSSSETTEQT
ncbi:MAG: peroxiredoxin family protein [Methanomassiliicoccaceae archaeon]|nr:peroxiredoxin family protein [Methanomassiliicoccaceae archaeon]